MATPDIVIDPFLRSILAASAAARAPCLALLDRLAAAESTPADGADLTAPRKELDAQLARLRGLQRAAALAVRRTKAATAEARAAVDTLHLQRRNLDYEQRHLRGEIGACEAYDHRYSQLPLVPVAEFLAARPEMGEADEHALMIARIEHERAAREALEAQRLELVKRRQKLIADNTKRKEELASLDDNLEKFIDAARPIQKIFEQEKEA